MSQKSEFRFVRSEIVSVWKRVTCMNRLEDGFESPSALFLIQYEAVVSQHFAKHFVDHRHFRL